MGCAPSSLRAGAAGGPADALAGRAEFLERYSVGERIGKGVQGSVYVATERETGRTVAVKRLAVAGLLGGGRSRREAAELELLCLEQVRHPNVVALVAHYPMPAGHYVVLEHVAGTNLLSYLAGALKRDDQAAVAAEKHVLLTQLVDAVAHIHARSIVFRDLHPENIMVTSAEPRTLKLIDFGSARPLVRCDRLERLPALGTTLFQAPEVEEEKPYGQQADMWGVGVLAYLMIGGEMPFDHSVGGYYQVLRCEYKDFNHNFSTEARNLVRKLLVKDPSKRLNAAQCRRHAFFRAKARKEMAGLHPRPHDGARLSISALVQQREVERLTVGVLASRLSGFDLITLQGWLEMSQEASIRGGTQCGVSKAGSGTALAALEAGQSIMSQSSSNGALEVLANESSVGDGSVRYNAQARKGNSPSLLGIAHARGLCSFDELLYALNANGFEAAANELSGARAGLSHLVEDTAVRSLSAGECMVLFRVQDLFNAISSAHQREEEQAMARESFDDTPSAPGDGKALPMGILAGAPGLPE